MRKGFTLIELLAVIAILAIIALIATPIIINIINDSREESHKRSVELYGSAVTQAIARAQVLDSTKELAGSYTTVDGKTLTKDDITITVEYDGPSIVCSTYKVYTNGTIYLEGCTVGGSNNTYAYGTKEPLDLTVCNEVTIGEEKFCILSETSTTQTLLAQKNITLSTSNPEQSDEAGTIAFTNVTTT